jgi:hypothetical protein
VDSAHGTCVLYIRVKTWGMLLFTAATMITQYEPFLCRNSWDMASTIIGGQEPLKPLKNPRSGKCPLGVWTANASFQTQLKRHHVIETAVAQSPACLTQMDSAGQRRTIVPSSSPSHTMSFTRVYQTVKFNRPSRNHSSAEFPCPSPQAVLLPVLP